MREMKDSGISWIGEIPKSWSLNRLKNICATSIKDGTHQTPTYTDEDKGVPFLSSKDVTKGYIEWKDIKYITPSLHKQLEKEIKPIKNDILLAKNGTTGVAAIVDTDTTFDIYVTLAVIRVNNKIAFPKYMLYVINSLICKNQFNERLVGIGVPNLHLNIIKNTKIILPLMREQHAIVDFLDSKCSEIDELTADIEKQIATLKEYKKSVITQAVTKGLDPNVEMKDSGVAWIEKIPMTWHIVRLKYLTTDIFDIDHYMPKDSNEEDSIPYLMIGDLRENLSSVKFSNCKKISKRDYLSLSKKNKSQIGDVVFARYATIGTVCYIDLNKNFLVSYACLTIKPKKHILGKYLYYYLKSNDFYNEAMEIINANTQGNIGKESLRNVGIVLPNLQLQEKIINFLDSKCADIDAAIAGKQKQLDVLKEYKKSLIYEYVTGKKEVPCHE